MAVSLYAYDVLGGMLPGWKLTVDDAGNITPDSTPQMRQTLELTMRRGNTDAAGAVRAMDGYSNGRVVYTTNPVAPKPPDWLLKATGSG